MDAIERYINECSTECEGDSFSALALLAAYKKVAEAGMKLSQTLRHPVYGYDINEIWEPDSEEHKALGAAIADLDKVMK